MQSGVSLRMSTNVHYGIGLGSLIKSQVKDTHQLSMNRNAQPPMNSNAPLSMNKSAQLSTDSSAPLFRIDNAQPAMKMSAGRNF